MCYGRGVPSVIYTVHELLAHYTALAATCPEVGYRAEMLQGIKRMAAGCLHVPMGSIRGMHRTFAVSMTQNLRRARRRTWLRCGSSISVQSWRGCHGCTAGTCSPTQTVSARVGYPWGAGSTNALVFLGRMAPRTMSAVARGGPRGQRCAPAASVGPRANSCAVPAGCRVGRHPELRGVCMCGVRWGWRSVPARNSLVGGARGCARSVAAGGADLFCCEGR